MKHISSLELSEWMAEYQIEPWGEARGDLQAGIVASTIANTNRDPDKKRDPFEVTDFMPKFELQERKKGMTGEQMLAFMRAMMPPLEGTNKNVN